MVPLVKSDRAGREKSHRRVWRGELRRDRPRCPGISASRHSLRNGV